jgi:OmcA/MtrC family decaheme c-type cytochrome
LGGIPGDSPESSDLLFHGGARNNVQYCAVCHTDQRKYGRTEATFNASTLTFSGSTYLVDGRAIGDLPNMVHKIHMGEILAKNGYNYADVLFDQGGYSQDIRNCQKCHSASGPTPTAQGDNWKSAPSALACGACHDGINFKTGNGVTIADALAGKTTSQFGHVGGAQPDDTACAICHKADSNDTYHLPVTPPNKGSALHVAGGNTNTNSAWIASNTSRLPAGAIKVTYEIPAKGVTVNASGQPVMKFRMLQNGVRKDLNVFATAAVNPVTGQKELWDNFMGSPSVYFVFSVPQDGISQPADFNATVNSYLRNIWAGTATGTGAGTLSAPDANGYYTVTLTGVKIPTNAKMLTGGLGYSYNVSSTLPLTQTNVAGYPVPDGSGLVNPSATNKTGGLIVIAPNVQQVADGFTGRRAIVEDSRCNACHQELGTFTEDAFHAGQRNDGSTCSWCHRPAQTSSGWSADSINFVHAIHAGAKRNVPYTWHAISKTDYFGKIVYPGVLARCEQCHVPGSYDFSNSASAIAAGLIPDASGVEANRRLFRTVGVGKYVGTVGGTVTSYTYSSSTGTCVVSSTPPTPQTEVGVFSLSPYVTADASGTSGTNYGVGFSYNAGLTTSNGCKPDGTPYSIPAGGTLAADSTTLVISPVSAACFACHDSGLAKSHMEVNGGAVYAPRAVALAKTEQCLVCHGSGRVADIKQVHAR